MQKVLEAGVPEGEVEMKAKVGARLSPIPIHAILRRESAIRRSAICG
jgi:hypothetical protein